MTGRVPLKRKGTGVSGENNLILLKRVHSFIQPTSYSRMVENRGVKMILVGKPEGKRALGRPSVGGRI
jgi:hypothetical protein